jgi:hypothetical protein
MRDVYIKENEYSVFFTVLKGVPIVNEMTETTSGQG